MTEVISKSKELVTEHVVVHARTCKWASEHVELIQDAAHAPNVLKHRPLLTSFSVLMFAYKAKMPYAIVCLWLSKMA